MKPATKPWIDKAEADYKAALVLNRQRKHPLPDQICFHCQQCAEKYLKAFLVETTIRFPKTHELIDLLALATPVDSSLSTLMPEFQFLTDFAVDYRYPGLVAKPQDARDAIEAIRAVRAAIRKRLGIKPPPRRKKKP
jgi:HEPN domain-containing protein